MPDRRSEMYPIRSENSPATMTEIRIAGTTFMVSSFIIQTPA